MTKATRGRYGEPIQIGGTISGEARCEHSEHKGGQIYYPIREMFYQIWELTDSQIREAIKENDMISLDTLPRRICKECADKETKELEMNIINKTPHALSIMNDEGKVIKVFEKSDNPVRLSTAVITDEPICGITTTKTQFGEVQNLPDFEEGVYYIVSQLVKSALPDRRDLLVPAELVRDENGNIIGCRSLGR